MITPCPVCGAVGRCVRADGRPAAAQHLLRTATEIEVSEELAERLDDVAVGAGAEPSEVLSYLIHCALCKAVGRGSAVPNLTQAKRRRIANAVASYQARR